MARNVPEQEERHLETYALVALVLDRKTCTEDDRVIAPGITLPAALARRGSA